MAWFLIPVCYKSFIANFCKKMFIKLVCSLKILIIALSSFKWAIGVFFKECNLLSKYILKVTICTFKILCSRLRTIIVNSFFPISVICLIVKSTSLVV